MTRLWFSWLICVLLFSEATLQADYVLPGFESVIDDIHIVEAEVTDMTKEGHAVLKVIETIRGSGGVASIVSVKWTCTPGATPHQMGVASGKRYIFFLMNDALFEETSFFEIIKQPDGAQNCQIHAGFREWMNLPESVVTKEGFVEFLRAKHGS